MGRAGGGGGAFGAGGRYRLPLVDLVLRGFGADAWAGAVRDR